MTLRPVAIAGNNAFAFLEGDMLCPDVILWYNDGGQTMVIDVDCPELEQWINGTMPDEPTLAEAIAQIIKAHTDLMADWAAEAAAEAAQERAFYRQLETFDPHRMDTEYEDAMGWI